MAYTTAQDATEALRTTFPGTNVVDNVRGWGWQISVAIWDLRVIVSSLSGNVSLVLEEVVRVQGAKSEGTVCRRKYENVESIEDLRRFLGEIHGVLIGICATILKACGADG